MSVRFCASAPGASSRAWMEGSLAELEAEMFPIVVLLMEVLP